MSFLIGIGGSLHCLGMCGPIALAMPLKERLLSVAVLNRLVYHAGRIFTYAILGLIIGIFGFGIALAGVQQYVSIAIGVWLILYIVFSKWLGKWLNGSRLIGPWVAKVKNSLGKQLNKKGNANRFILGMLNGLLPCGLIYIALANTVLAETPAEGMLFMAAFGLGTIPALLILPFAGRYVPVRKWNLTRFIPVMVFSLGVFLIIRGVSFDYPLMHEAGEFIKKCLP